MLTREEVLEIVRPLCPKERSMLAAALFQVSVEKNFGPTAAEKLEALDGLDDDAKYDKPQR